MQAGAGAVMRPARVPHDRQVVAAHEDARRREPPHEGERVQLDVRRRRPHAHQPRQDEVIERRVKVVSATARPGGGPVARVA